jgi:hypothetical protein
MGETCPSIVTMADSSPSPTFSHTWILWYHDPNNADYSLASYIKIMECETPSDFWSVVEAISPEAWNSGMFFFMREGYRPLWDAPENDKGGAWSKKVDAHETHAVFVDCMVHCLANTMLRANNDVIVGVTLSPKGQFHIIKVWNTLATVSDRKLFSPTLKMKIGDDIAYKAHNLRPK